MSDLATDLACPGGDRKAHLARILPTLVQDHTIGFLHKRREAIAAGSTGLVPMLDNFRETRATHEVATLAPIRTLALSMANEAEDTVYAAALLGAHLTAHGRPGDWSARFQKPHRVRFGRLLTPELIALSVEGGAVSYETDSGERRTIAMDKNAEGVLEIAAADLGDGRAILVPDLSAIDTLSIHEKEGHSQSELSTRVSEIEQAIRLTRGLAPEYIAWYGDAVQAVVGLPVLIEGTVTSRTNPGQNGIVYISSPCWGIRMAESLIHEASHQYYYAGLQELNWTNLEDEKLYYSPYKRMDRPIERILLTFHAFGNVVLFYRQVLATTTNQRLREWTELNLKRHEEDLMPFVGHLEKSPGLTREGRRLFETLAGRVGR